jgi:hypothetical protein
VAIIAGLGLYVGVPVYRDIAAARTTLDAPLDELSSREIERAEDHLRTARDRLGSPPARVLRAIPLVGANFDAVDAAAGSLLPVLASGKTLDDRLRAVEDEGLLEDGAARLDLLEELREPLADQAAGLRALMDSLRTHRTGVLAPPLWNALDELLTRGTELEAAAGDAEQLVEFVDALLGADGKRTYLIVLINNAELRGAGGVLTGLGSMTASNGKLELVDLADHTEFSKRPYQRVPAPPEYVDRYAVFKANTTLTVNTTFSPDVPDVAIVAAGIYEAIKGVQTDGALIVDPRGLAALMPPGSRIRVPRAGVTVSNRTLPDFVYSDAYELFDKQALRRAALMLVGKKAFETILGGGLGNRQSVSAAADAFAEGHLRFVPFDPDEQRALSDAGATGDLTRPRVDTAMVVSQNFGSNVAAGTKLDYWVERNVSHECELKGGGALCSTTVELENRVPNGLSRYVAGRPYGLLRSYVETYVPEEARLLSVTADEAPAEYRIARQTGNKSVGVYVEVPQGDSTKISVRYELLDLDSDEGYSLEAIPQPLARDARISLRIEAPDGWTIEGPGSKGTETYEYAGAFARTIRVEAAADERTGLPALWARLAFWD